MKNQNKVAKCLNGTIFLCLFIFLTSGTLYGQVSNQNVIDELSKKINSLKTQMKAIKVAAASVTEEVPDNSDQFEAIKGSLNSVEEKLSQLNSNEPAVEQVSLKMVSYLSNIEKEIKRLVELQVAEKEEESEIVDDATPEIELVESSVSLSVGSSLVSRYVWRGSDFGESPSIQPYVAVSIAGLEFGAWASYPFASVSSDYNELDLYLSYSLDTEIGSFGAVVTDFYYPNAGLKFTDWDGEGEGAHTLELSFSFTPSSSPLSLMAALNVHNDLDDSFYFELGYSASVGDMPLSITLGAAKGSSGWYGITTEKFEVINANVTISKDLKITDSFSLPVFGSYILNPYVGKGYLVLGVSL